MNFDTFTTWAYDRLKRRLHEAAKDIQLGSIEAVENAKICQKRYDKIITAENINCGKKHLFREAC